MNLITTEEQLQKFVEYYSKVDAFAFDVETIGKHRGQPVINTVAWISFATHDSVDVIPLGHPNGEFQFHTKPLLKSGAERIAKGKPLSDAHFSKNKERWTPQFSDPPKQLLPAQVFEAIRPLMFSSKLKIGHNLKFDLKSVAKYYKGQIPSKPHFDTLMAGFITNNLNRNSLSLKDSVKRELGIEIAKGVGEDISQHSFAEVAEYSAIDADVTWKLYQALEPKLTDSLQRVWRLEMDVLGALCDMELTGALIDETQLDILAEQISADLDLAKAKAFKEAGEIFSINSVQAKQRLLFAPNDQGKVRLKPNVKFRNSLTPKGRELAQAGKEPDHTFFSVSSDALEPFRGKDPLVNAILEYQDLNKLMTTYVTPYRGGEVERETNGKKKVIQKDSLLINGRVHAKFNAHGADTGRMSSSEPNLQNIPSSGDYGKLVRSLFVAPPDHKLIVADYSQIEPRLIAAFSQDPRLVENYRTGGDIYTTIGDTMKVERKVGKMLVLAISYGVGPDKIASSIGCTMREAQDLMNRFEAEFKSISTYKARVIRKAKEHSPMPFASTIFGRRRYIPDLKSRDSRLVARAERQAFNTVIQGSAADIMKLALVRAHSCFVEEPDVNITLTVHDELVTVAPTRLADEVAEAIRISMEDVKLEQLAVPLVADIHIVDNWGQAK
jgi:DNA polymerase I-like protein with 3'-5' exonuclease and polymerase domains